MTPGPLIVISGPSGSGKSTLIQRLLADMDRPLRLSVSTTTRRPRRGEKDGVDYQFWNRGRFTKECDKGGFLEWAEVHGQLYGTPRREVEPYRKQGQGVLQPPEGDFEARVDKDDVRHAALLAGRGPSRAGCVISADAILSGGGQGGGAGLFFHFGGGGHPV